MTKIAVNLVCEVLKKNHVEPEKLRAIIEEINAVVANETDEPTPTVKKQFVILVSDPDNKIPGDNFVGWVLQIEESESVATTQARINRAAYDFNASKKGRLLPVKTVGEAIESVPAKHFKDAGVWVKTKTPVFVLRTNNEIPKE